MARAYYFSYEPGRNLNVKVEGVFIDRNWRDLGASFNDCSGAPRLKTGQIFRAAAWFSGWSCDSIGDPTLIYTLNYKPEDGREYFCHARDGNRVGRHFNTAAELSDLEFRQTWDNEAQRSGACALIADSFAAIARGDRLLIHCDAGRDRTGTYAALLEALVAESQAPLDARTLEAIECEYRKSDSLAPAKFGRMQSFIKDIQAHEGSVRAFLTQHCHLPDSLLDETTAALSWPSGQSLVP